MRYGHLARTTIILRFRVIQFSCTSAYQLELGFKPPTPTVINFEFLIVNCSVSFYFSVKQFWILDLGFAINSTDKSACSLPSRNCWSKYRKKIKNVIKYHGNHFGVASLAHNKKKAIQGLSEQVMLYPGNRRILKVYQQ